MSIIDYLKDKLLLIILSVFNFLIVLTIILIFKGSVELIFLVLVSNFLPLLIFFIVDYYKKRRFYLDLKLKLAKLDQKYLASELIDNDDFMEAKLIKDILYDVDKCYLENINNLRRINTDFKDYIELWCHEIKTPIATERLIIANNESNVTKSILEEVIASEDLIEQVLFYARMDTLESDYLIRKINLREVIQSVIKRNKKNILDKKIKVSIPKKDIDVMSDSKWLEYIINQVVVNAIKYVGDKPVINIDIVCNKDNVVLNIKDNGIGIAAAEIDRVFDKGFTGTNGRILKVSTGLGLYLAKRLCDKLGHNIMVSSVINEYTMVSIIIPSNSLTNVIVTKE